MRASAILCTVVSVPTFALTLISPAVAQTNAATGGVPAATTAADAPPPNGPVYAAADTNGGVADMIVTAQRRNESIQKVPISITAISGPQLEARGITNVLDLGGAVPGLQFQNFSGVQLPFLRGVGATGSALGNESSVASYVDGIYYARVPAAFAELRNVERVEVLKGPQGTLFGRNATGGVINIVTRDPSHDKLIEGSLGYGRFNAFQGDLYVTGGLSETIAVDVSVTGKTSNGFGKNLATGGGYGYDDGFLVRSKLIFEPTDATKFVLTGFYAASHDSGQKAAFPGTANGTVSSPNQVYTTDNIGFYNSVSNDNFDKYKFWGVSLRAEQQLSFARLINISAYSRLKEMHDFEGDYTPRPDFVVPIKGKLDLFTQEIQLASLPNSPLNWIVGAYYYNNYSDYYSVEFMGPLLFGPGISAPAHQRSISYAGYAQATYEILPRLKLTGGLRFTRDDTSAFGRLDLKTTPPVDLLKLPMDRTKINRVTFRAALDYQATDDTLLYASFNRGAKAGTYNILTYTGSPNKPEGLDAYEVGFKSAFFDRRVRLSGALFYYNIKNPQVQLVKAGTIFFSNAGSSRVKGAEFEAQAAIGGGLSGRASVTFLDSKYQVYGSPGPNGTVIDGAPSNIPDLVNGGAIAGPAINARGNRTPLAAKTTFNLGLDYKLDTAIGNFLATVDLYHNSGYFYEPDNFLHQPEFNLVNAQLRYSPNEHYSIRFWGRNLLDKKYTIAATTQVSFVHEAGFPFTPAPPRTYGVAVDFKF